MTLIERIEHAMRTDEECPVKQSEYLLRAYEQADTQGKASIDAFCIALCGWSFETIVSGEC